MGKPSLLPLLLLLFFSSISSSIAEIKTLKISADTRAIILFEKFGFTHHGFVTITVSDVSFGSPLPDPDTALFGFFLLSDERLIQATYESQQQQQNPNPNSNPSCILSSPYVRPLFKFKDFADANYSFYSRSYPITHPDEYSLFFANCNPESQVSMAVRTEMFNLRPDGSPDYLSVGQSPDPSLYFVFALAYVAFLAVWVSYIIKNRLSSHRIHLLMAGLLLTKVLNLLFAAEDQHYVRVTGTPHGWDVLFYIFQFLKGVLLFTVIILISIS